MCVISSFDCCCCCIVQCFHYQMLTFVKSKMLIMMKFRNDIESTWRISIAVVNLPKCTFNTHTHTQKHHLFTIETFCLWSLFICPPSKEMEMKMEPSSPTDKRQQFSRCSSTNSVITSNSSAHNSGEWFCFWFFFGFLLLFLWRLFCKSATHASKLTRHFYN